MMMRLSDNKPNIDLSWLMFKSKSFKPFKKTSVMWLNCDLINVSQYILVVEIKKKKGAQIKIVKLKCNILFGEE